MRVQGLEGSGFRVQGIPTRFWVGSLGVWVWGLKFRVEVSYWRLIDSCITQLKVQGPSRTCIESEEEEEGG